MTTSEDQPQSVVFNTSVGRDRRVASLQLFCNLFLRRIKSSTSSQYIDRLKPSGGNQPRTRICRDAFPRPPFQRRRKRVMHRVFRQIKIAQ